MAYYTPIGLPPPLDITSGPSLTSTLYNPNLYNNVLTAANNTITATTASDAITASKIGNIYTSAATAGTNLTDLAKTGSNTITSIGSNFGLTADAIASNYTDQVKDQNAAKVATDTAYYDYQKNASADNAAVNTAGINAVVDVVKSDNQYLTDTNLAKIDANKETEIHNQDMASGIVKDLTDSTTTMATSRDKRTTSVVGTIGSSGGKGSGGGSGGSSTGTDVDGGSSSGGNSISRPPPTTSGGRTPSNSGDIMSTIIKFIIGIVVIIGLGVGGYYGYKYIKKEQAAHEKETGEKISIGKLFEKKANKGGHLHNYFG